ncbi:heterokaryon incompatibility domain-containing protein [Trichoderma sp. SZMC 28013]
MNQTISNTYPGPILEAENAFRLLELQAGQDNDPVTIRILACSFGTVSYEAVSYTWGDADQKNEIKVLSHSANNTMFVTANCHNALVALRKPHEPRVLWIDSICINQHSIPERNHQISLMAQIYQGARRVVVYLGQSAHGSDEAMRSICEIDHPSDYGAYPSWDTMPECPSNIESIRALFKRPWFCRVWVLQEIAFAKDAVFVCGQYEVGWDSICTFCHWTRNNRWIKGGLPYPIEYTVKKSHSRTHFIHYNHRLYELLKNTKDCQATDARDKVYAMLPLLKWEHENMIRELEASQNQAENKSVDEPEADRLRQASFIQADYTMSVQQVYTKLTIILLEHFGLQALQIGPALRHVEKLPSWVIDWEAITKSPYQFQQPLTPFQPQNASTVENSSIWSVSRFFLVDKEPQEQLRVRASQIGTITFIGDVCDIRRNIFPLKQWTRLGSGPKWWHQMPTMPPGLTERQPGFWRQRFELSPFAETLAAGYIVYADVVREAVEALTTLDESDNAAETNETHMRFEDYPKKLPPSYCIQAQKILNACDGRRFFITDTGHIGLAPEAATTGDLTFKVNGCDAPFVMRPWKDAETETHAIVSGQTETPTLNTHSMTMVGECWIHGISPGEREDLFHEVVFGKSKPESSFSYLEHLIIY